MNISFEVTNQIIKRTDENKVVADSRNYLSAEFTFTDEWQGTITAVFKKDGTAYAVILDEENKCTVPWEVISEGRFSVSCFCGNRVTANRAFVGVIASGYEEGETPSEPTPDVYAELVERTDNAVNAANTVFTAYENGELKGDKGDNAELNFSTAEQRVGKWVDGKPLYERSYSVTLPGNNNLTLLSGIDVSDFDTVTELKGVIYDEGEDEGTPYRYLTPFTNSYYRSNADRLQMLFIRELPSNTGINVYCGLTFNNLPAIITVQYTKLSD